MRIDWQGKPAALLVMRDISSRVTNRMKRLESQARFAALVGNIPGTVYQGSLCGDEGLSFSYLSDGVGEMFGVEPEAALADGEALLAKIHPEDRAGFIAAMRVSEKAMNVADAEFRVPTGGGEMCWVRGSARPRVRDDGTVLWDGVFLDVTERQAALECMTLAKDTAEMANRAKADFLANMSHELRTPLNTIMGFSEVIEGEIFGPVGSARYREYAGDIHSSGEYLLSLVNDILDLSKIEAGKLELHDDVVNVEKVIA